MVAGRKYVSDTHAFVLLPIPLTGLPRISMFYLSCMGSACGNEKMVRNGGNPPPLSPQNQGVKSAILKILASTCNWSCNYNLTETELNFLQKESELENVRIEANLL